MSKIVCSENHHLPENLIHGEGAFNKFMSLTGVSYRKVARRETLKVEIDGHHYFIKKHFGVGWAEILKNWITFKRPVISSQDEVNAILALSQLGIPTTPYVAHGIESNNLAKTRSFLLTESLGDIVTLEDLALAWKVKRPNLRHKRAIIRRVAEIARIMHAHGIYHRDFYICHFCIRRSELSAMPPRLYVLDLHRAVIDKEHSRDMQMKDLAALYFSAHTICLNNRDIYSFLKSYFPEYSTKSPQVNKTLNYISKRAQKLYKKYVYKTAQGIRM